MTVRTTAGVPNTLAQSLCSFQSSMPSLLWPLLGAHAKNKEFCVQTWNHICCVIIFLSCIARRRGHTSGDRLCLHLLWAMELLPTHVCTDGVSKVLVTTEEWWSTNKNKCTHHSTVCKHWRFQLSCVQLLTCAIPFGDSYVFSYLDLNTCMKSVQLPCRVEHTGFRQWNSLCAW